MSSTARPTGTAGTTAGATASQASQAFARRRDPAEALAADAEAIAATCHAMARRFHRGGRLVVFADGGSETDVAHVVVEFVHPVIVGKRALPAFALAAPDQAAQLELFAGPSDIALGISADDAGAPTPTAPTVPVTLAAAARIGLLTVALLGGVGPVPDGLADHVLVVRSADPLVVKEMQVTTYHVLWELVHVFLDQPGLL